MNSRTFSERGRQLRRPQYVRLFDRTNGPATASFNKSFDYPGLERSPRFSLVILHTSAHPIQLFGRQLADFLMWSIHVHLLLL